MEKIHQERSQLVGLKNHSTSPVKNKEKMQDAFDVDLKANNDFGGVPDIEAVDLLRSIGSVSMNQGAIGNMAQFHNGSPLVLSSQY